MKEDIKIKVVDDEACPACGSRWGHEDPRLDYPNRPKVGDKNNDWWWNCCNPNCKVAYYLPRTGEIELEKSPEEYQAMLQRIHKDLEEIEVEVVTAN